MSIFFHFLDLSYFLKNLSFLLREQDLGAEVFGFSESGFNFPKNGQGIQQQGQPGE